MNSLIIAFGLLGASQNIFMTLGILSSSNPRRVKLVFVAFMFCILCYLVSPLIIAEFGKGFVYSISWMFASLIQIMALFLVWSIFEEYRPYPSVFWVLLVADAIFVVVKNNHVLGLANDKNMLVIAGIIQNGFLFWALLLIYLNRKNDLVESRIKTRFRLVGGLVVLVLLVFTTIVMSIWLPQHRAFLGVLLLVTLIISFLFSLFANWLFLQRNPTYMLVDGVLPEQPKNASAETSRECTSLLTLIIEQRIYADHDLTANSLSKMVKMPEYRLRNLVNQELGYRNFNQFINKLRLDEAEQRLLKQSHLPVLSIALDVGFRSISSFNTSFKMRYQASPTEFRKRQLNDNQAYCTKVNSIKVKA